MQLLIKKFHFSSFRINSKKCNCRPYACSLLYYFPFWFYCSLGAPQISNMVLFDLLKCQTAARTLFEWVYSHHFRGKAIAKENLERKHFLLTDFDLKDACSTHLFFMESISQHIHRLLFIMHTVQQKKKKKLIFLRNCLHFADVSSVSYVATEKLCLCLAVKQYPQMLQNKKKIKFKPPSPPLEDFFTQLHKLIA